MRQRIGTYKLIILNETCLYIGPQAKGNMHSLSPNIILRRRRDRALAYLDGPFEKHPRCFMRSASSCGSVYHSPIMSCHGEGNRFVPLCSFYCDFFSESHMFTQSHIPPFAGSPFPQRKGDTFCVISANCNDENCKSYCNQYFPGTAASCDHKTTQGRIICCCVP